ncbi:MAG: hypothetical protein JSS57_07655 [Proteobacteria bacterium]|nr:hypothetical protein [Pseudomonadota bacterium]
MDDKQQEAETTKTDDQTFTIQECQALHTALRALDGRETVEAGVKITKPYRLTGGKIHYSIAHNLRKLERVGKDYAEAHNKLVASTFEGKPPAEQPEKMEQFQKDAQAIMQQPGINLSELRKIHFDDLNTDENQQPSTVIAALLPILTNLPKD